MNNSSVIQSLLFERDYFTLPKARQWARTHKFRTTKVDKTKNYYRFRQVAPAGVKIVGMKQLTTGVKATIAR